MYIVFEGIDLVGKGTQIAEVKNRFPEFLFTREPGGTEFGKKIREILLHDDYYLSRLSEFFLFIADRSEHFQRVVKPNLQSGKVVVSDRSMISGMAYARENGGVDDDTIESINLLAVENRKPDLVIFLKISQDELIERRKDRGFDNIELRGVEYSLQVQDSLKYWMKRLNLRTLEIDASEDVEAISKKIISEIESLRN